MNQVFEYLKSFISIVLMLAGIGGVCWDLFKEGGWLGKILGKFWYAQLNYPMIAIPVTIAVVVLGKMWHDRQVEKGYTSKLPAVLIYLVMAAGVYYLWRFSTELL